MRDYIYGAGGHGKVVLDAMQTAGLDCQAFLDDKNVTFWMGLSVQPLSSINLSAVRLHLAIGDNKAREKIANQLGNVDFLSVRHVNATTADTTELGDGVFLAASCILGPSTKVGSHCIINHMAVVDHDCTVDDFSHIAPHSTLGGGVKVGRGVLIGAGSVILPGIEVGDYAIIGAGAIVTKNITAGTTVLGNPARPVN